MAIIIVQFPRLDLMNIFLIPLIEYLYIYIIWCNNTFVLRC